MPLFPGSSSHWIGFAAILIVILLVLSVTRKRDESLSGGREQSARDRADPQYWKGGVFYFNPDDPSLFVKKRYGFGWTLNFGRRISWLILAVPVLTALFGEYLSSRR